MIGVVAPVPTLVPPPGQAVVTGTIHGVGLGPGACDLMSVRADRLVRGARHVAISARRGGRDRRGGSSRGCCATT